MNDIVELQDLGEIGPTIRPDNMVSSSGVATLTLDDESSFIDSMDALREVLDEHYGDHLEELSSEDEKLVIERVVLRSDEHPYIEFNVVEELSDE
jgi:demethoxyubiquinone hydroxylase (CLK1/Coq7/Cat5 family)